jgi:hypothetical protein
MDASRRRTRALAGGAWLVVLASGAGAQDTRAFGPGATSVGPTVGFGRIAGATVAVGGRVEHGVIALPAFGNGVLGVAAGADVYTMGPASGVGRSRTVPVAVTANYHFVLNDRRLDPFVGAGVGYRFGGSATGGAGDGGNRASLLGRGGVRWTITSLLSLYAEAGTGGPAASCGLMLALR